MSFTFASISSIARSCWRPALCLAAAGAIASPGLAGDVGPRGVQGPGAPAGLTRFNLRCPSPVTFQAPMPAAAGWSGNMVSWNLQLDPTVGWGLQVVPHPGSVTVVCHYIAKNFDGVVIKGFGYSQTVPNGSCAPNGAKDGFACTKP